MERLSACRRPRTLEPEWGRRRRAVLPSRRKRLSSESDESAGTLSGISGAATRGSGGRPGEGAQKWAGQLVIACLGIRVSGEGDLPSSPSPLPLSSPCAPSRRTPRSSTRVTVDPITVATNWPPRTPRLRGQQWWLRLPLASVHAAGGCVYAPGVVREFCGADEAGKRPKCPAVSGTPGALAPLELVLASPAVPALKSARLAGTPGRVRGLALARLLVCDEPKDRALLVQCPRPRRHAS